jgi:EAL domain-containing protein (putative c-di-GMP-specific phosphodiesterase class I)/GGDEF domain-containing protein
VNDVDETRRYSARGANMRRYRLGTRAMTSGRRATAHPSGPTDLSMFSMLELPVPSFVFENGDGRILSMNSTARKLFGFTELDLIGRTKAPDLLGYDFKLDVGSSSHRQIALPSHGTFDVIVGARPASGNDPPRSLVMLIPSIGGPTNHNDASPVVSWDLVAQRCRAFQGELLCVAIGVVGLPAVNSEFSRSAGDYAIAEFHHRLVLAGGDDCVVERVSGSSFLALLTSGGGDRLVVQRFLNVARRPIAGPHGVVVLGCAAGVSVGHPRRPLVLIARAVRNLEAALVRGAGTSEWVESSSRLKTTPLDLAAPLLAAVQRGEIVAAFQPVVSLLAGDIIEFEALARWPGHEEVSPRSMVELARNIGILGEFRTCVVTSAVDLLRRHVGSEGLRRVSIDVTAKEFASAAFAETIVSAFASAGIATSWLQIEITDAVADSDMASIASTIDALRYIGVRIALDGLRDGAVSWLALMRLDVDAIKVESDLLASGVHDGRAGAALRSILELATEFGVDVIAKGVETIEQHEQLVSAGCLFAQGWLYGAPEAVEAVDPTLVARVQSKWSNVACSRRSPGVATIGSKLRALKAPLRAGAWLDVGPLARQVVAGGGYRSGAVSEQPMTGVAEGQDVEHEPTRDVSVEDNP